MLAALILRVEFVPKGKETSPTSWPVKDIYFKILPKGMSGFKGILVGAPTLDAPPHGLGHRVTESTHYWQAIDTHTERLETKRRVARMDEVKQWLQHGDFSETQIDGVRNLQEGARELEAFYDGPELTLSSGERAVVPVSWAGKVPSEDFYCTETEAHVAGAQGRIYKGSLTGE